MDQERFAQGKRSYRAGNFAQAAQDFLESAEEGIARGNGAAFHQTGNAFLQLGRLGDALTMYQNALRDDTYTNMSGVYQNIGFVYAKEGNYAESAEAYELAATYPECEKPYKCHLGVAQNQMRLGNVDKAAIAYKKAAVDINNPARDKALYNLALCLLELKQPLSAVESLKLALEFPDCTDRGKVLSSLAIAYTLLDSDEEAVETFEQALVVLGGAPLPASAVPIYEAAKARLAMLSAGQTRVLSESPYPDSNGYPPDSGEIQSIDTSAVTMADEQSIGAYNVIGSDEEVAQFFALSDAEVLAQSKQLAKSERRGRWWKILLAVILTLILLCGVAAGVAWYLGLGYPFASDVVSQCLDAYATEGDIASYWALPVAQAERSMAIDVPLKGVTYTIKPETGRMNESTVQVVAEKEETKTYLTFTLVRSDIIHWKISGLSATTN